MVRPCAIRASHAMMPATRVVAGMQAAPPAAWPPRAGSRRMTIGLPTSGT